MKSKQKFLQTDWEGMDALHKRLLPSRSIQEKIRDWLELQETFQKQLEATADIFYPEREAHLKVFQERLKKIGPSVKG